MGTSSTLSYMANLTPNLGNYLKIDLFPFNCSYVDSDDNLIQEDQSCTDCGSFLVQSELEKFQRLQDAGLNPNYKCPACRDCKSCLGGSGKELLSMKEEYQQKLIEDSVRIDENISQAIAHLAFAVDPEEGLSDNKHLAFKRL